MKITTEKSLREFEFWSGAKDTAIHLNWDDFDTIESILEELNPNGMDETEINDLFWFESDTIADWLGYKNWEVRELAQELRMSADDMAELEEDFNNMDADCIEDAEEFTKVHNLTEHQFEKVQDLFR